MVEFVEKKDEKTGKKELVIDKRTESKLDKPPHVKHLRYSRHLPVSCNNCPFRPQEEGGNGICDKYVADGVCVIRADIRKMFNKFEERNQDKLTDLMEAEFVDDYEMMRFFKEIEVNGS